MPVSHPARAYALLYERYLASGDGHNEMARHIFERHYEDLLEIDSLNDAVAELVAECDRVDDPELMMHWLGSFPRVVRMFV